MKKPFFIILSIVVVIVILIWLGLKIKPKPIKPLTETSPGSPDTFQLPENLPAPVERFYELVYGDTLPYVETFIISGRGRIRFQGITMPAKLRFIHTAGQGYRHLMETTFWGISILKVDEVFIDWKSRLELPFGVVENEPKIDEAANLGLWSETLMFPSVYLSTEGVRWVEIDGSTAKLIVPFKGSEDRFTVYFNEDTGLIDYMETMRWKEADDPEKTRWQAQALAWGEVNGLIMPTSFAAQWKDEDSPWLVAEIEEAVFNVDVSDYFDLEGSEK